MRTADRRKRTVKAGPQTVSVLRLGHRPARDKRVAAHVALPARAFGGGASFVSTKDVRLEATLRALVEKFGGPFQVRTGVRWQEVVRSWRGTIVHLTMYGEGIDDVLPRIPTRRGLLIVVRARKVPPAKYV